MISPATCSRLVALAMVMPAMLMAAPPPGTRISFVSCPIIRDTRSVPCWLSDYQGDRYYLTNAEYRWLAVPRLFGIVGVGVAAFVDHGGAWFRGDARRSGTDAGLGFRIGSIRSAGSLIGRLDFAYRFESDIEPGGWVISLGRGFAWQRF